MSQDVLRFSCWTFQRGKRSSLSSTECSCSINEQRDRYCHFTIDQTITFVYMGLQQSLSVRRTLYWQPWYSRIFTDYLSFPMACWLIKLFFNTGMVVQSIILINISCTCWSGSMSNTGWIQINVLTTLSLSYHCHLIPIIFKQNLKH